MLNFKVKQLWEWAAVDTMNLEEWKQYAHYNKCTSGDCSYAVSQYVPDGTDDVTEAKLTALWNDMSSVLTVNTVSEKHRRAKEQLCNILRSYPVKERAGIGMMSFYVGRAGSAHKGVHMDYPICLGKVGIVPTSLFHASTENLYSGINPMWDTEEAMVVPTAGKKSGKDDVEKKSGKDGMAKKSGKDDVEKKSDLPAERRIVGSLLNKGPPLGSTVCLYLDVVVASGTHIGAAFEIVDGKETSWWRRAAIKKICSGFPVYEVSADWILQQKDSDVTFKHEGRLA